MLALRREAFMPEICEEIAPENRRWYILVTAPSHERIAAAHLIARQFKAYLPVIPDWTTRGVRRTKIRTLKPMFPGYLFVRLDMGTDNSRLDHITNAPGVVRFLQLDNDLAILPDADMARVENVEKFHADSLQRPPRLSDKFSLGEKVRVGYGPFSGFNADIIRLEDGDRIKVLIGLMRRATAVTIDASDLEKL